MTNLEKLQMTRAEREKMTEDFRKKKEAEFKKLRDRISKVSKDPNVLFMLRHLKNICGQAHSSIVVNSQTGEVNQTSTLVNEARRSVYLDIRKLLTDEVISLVETKEEKNAL